jgi:hypothetical protein
VEFGLAEERQEVVAEEHQRVVAEEYQRVVAEERRKVAADRVERRRHHNQGEALVLLVEDWFGQDASLSTTLDSLQRNSEDFQCAHLMAGPHRSTIPGRHQSDKLGKLCDGGE